ncbi:MAG: putative lipopolysaccharide heptosyltransferase III [Magnetococcales bacterium]|nr:putative lipopolysaccharide heptosyltransferase III [Magnetococcales bacterium]
MKNAPESSPESSLEPRGILLIKSRHIGDVLLMAPLVSTLKQRHPASHIAALVKPECTPMLTHHPHLETVLAFPAPQPGQGKAALLWRQLKAWFTLARGTWDLAINTTEGDRGILNAFFSRAGKRVGFIHPRREKPWRLWLLTDPIPYRGGKRHMVIHNLELAGPGLQDRVVRLVPGAEAQRSALAKLRATGWDGQRPLVQIHPTSRWNFKCWSDTGMAQAADFFHESGWMPLFTCGPGAEERARLDAILALCRHPSGDLGGGLSLKELAAVSGQCRLYFGVDTAPMHIAASQNTPVVALFGPTGVYDWGPWPNGWAGEDTPYGALRGVQRSDPHLVIQKDWACVPCGKAGCEGSKKSRCLDELDFDREVRPWLAERLERLQRLT